MIDEHKDGSMTLDMAGDIVLPDADGDRVPDRTDNCRFTANPTQTPVATPVVTPPFGLTLASCTDSRIGTAVAADVCDGGPVALSNNAPRRFDVGRNIVTWTGEDALHRRDTARQIVRVVDRTDPMFTSVPADVALDTCGPASLGHATATDDCAGRVRITNHAPRSFPVGRTAVTWKATDASGNRATATQLVTVVDTVTPTVACVGVWRPDDIFFVFSADACGAAPIRLGSFVLGNGELIKITRSRLPGVRLLGRHGHIRHFSVGPGENVIGATDPSGNVGTAMCR